MRNVRSEAFSALSEPALLFRVAPDTRTCTRGTFRPWSWEWQLAMDSPAITRLQPRKPPPAPRPYPPCFNPPRPRSNWPLGRWESPSGVAVGHPPFSTWAGSWPCLCAVQAQEPRPLASRGKGARRFRRSVPGLSQWGVGRAPMAVTGQARALIRGRSLPPWCERVDAPPFRVLWGVLEFDCFETQLALSDIDLREKITELAPTSSKLK